MVTASLGLIPSGTFAVAANQSSALQRCIGCTADGLLCRRSWVPIPLPIVVSVIDTTTGRPVVKAIKVGPFPLGLAVTPDGSRVYVVKN